MSQVERADAYLTIPPAYAARLGGLQWAHRCDAIERDDGTTLALTEELTLFLEGLFSRPPVVPFAFALHVFEMFKGTPRGLGWPTECWKLKLAYEAVRGALGLVRNAGVLTAELCAGLPASAASLNWSEVALAIDRRRQFGERKRADVAAEEPPLAPEDFARRIAGRIGRLDGKVLEHWLKFGSGPSRAGKKLAEPVEALPQRLAELQELARRRPRLAGAIALAATVDAALTLPPRRRARNPLPQGGYADVTTRGEPERLLPSQFALDTDEFIRRFAARELLYFQREEPREPQRPRREIVLDQGVRTWGGVRLALTAAALALLGRDVKRGGDARLAFTSSPERNGLELEAVALADRLEASDLSPNPGDCLERVLRESGADAGPRDIILLTHPRNLREEVIVRAVRERKPADRLFALSVDERGRAELMEWAEGGPTPIRSFRVDLATAETIHAQAGPAPPRPGRTWGAWSGDVEPIPFPFRPGIVSELGVCGFDADGHCLVACGRDGVPHALTLDGSSPEVLPRAFINGIVLKKVEAVLGVVDGVVLCGSIASNTLTITPSPVAQPTETVVAAHYDLAARSVKVYILGPFRPGLRWFAYPDLHCIAVRDIKGQIGDMTGGIDLTPTVKHPGATHRAMAAQKRSIVGASPPHILPVRTRWSTGDAPIREPVLYLWGNAIEVKGTEPPWARFEPMRDGLPLMAGVSIESAQNAGDVLAVVLTKSGERTTVLFRGPEGHVIFEDRQFLPNSSVNLSRDGRLFARISNGWTITIADVGGPSRASSTQAKLHSNHAIQLFSPFLLAISIGPTEHAFQIQEGRLQHAVEPTMLKYPRPKKQAGPESPTIYDQLRFPPQLIVRAGKMHAVLDRLGQVLVFGADGAVAACFIIRREHAAAWTPSGAFWGDPSLIGGPPTPDAERIIGEALEAAAGG